MKNYKLMAVILSVTLLVSGCSSQTNDADNDADKASIEKHENSICKSVEGIAKNIMTARLDGNPIEAALDVIENMDGIDLIYSAFKVKSKEMIFEAYSQPNYMTKERAIREFGSTQYINCFDDKFAEELRLSR